MLEICLVTSCLFDAFPTIITRPTDVDVFMRAGLDRGRRWKQCLILHRRVREPGPQQGSRLGIVDSAMPTVGTPGGTRILGHETTEQAHVEAFVSLRSEDRVAFDQWIAPFSETPRFSHGEEKMVAAEAATAFNHCTIDINSLYLKT